MKILTLILLVGAGIVVAYVLLALFERVVPRRVLRWYQRKIGSPLFRWGAGMVPGWVLLETVGRKTGRRLRVPLGGRLKGETCWVLAATGRETQYVRNIEQNPNVRVRIHGHWRNGVARPLPDEDPRPHVRANPLNGVFLRLTGHDLLVLRIDLEPVIPRSR